MQGSVSNAYQAVGSFTYANTNQVSISVETWDQARDLAVVVAQQGNQVQVRKVGNLWAVSWTIPQPTYTPYYPKTIWGSSVQPCKD